MLQRKKVVTRELFNAPVLLKGRELFYFPNAKDKEKINFDTY